MPLSELPEDLTGQWQVVDLAGGQDHVMLRVTLPRTHVEAHVTFSREGLARLRGGLATAGLDPRFFAWPPPGDPNRPPYRGLKPLETEDAGIFFGRDAPIVEALDKLRGLREAAAPRLLVVLGASGSGKSSFLRAGLLPRLARDDRNFLPLPLIRPERAAISGENGLVMALDAALAGPEVTYSRAAIRAAVAQGADAVRPMLQRLADAAFARTLVDEADAPRPTVVLAIDQAEELFQADGLAEGEALLKLVRGLIAADPPTVIALFAIRSDAYDRLETAKALDGLRQETFPLLPMPRGAYQTVIEGSAARLANTDRRLTIEPQLTQRLLQDIETGGGSDALPLLAFTLEQLYSEYGRTLRLADYEAFGGIGGAIEAAVKRALRAADADPRIPRDRDARLLLLRRGLIPWLAGIDPETGSPRRRVANRDDVPEEARPLIDLLVEQRLLGTDRNAATGEITIEPAHESLLRQWRLLKGWLDEDFAALMTLEAVKRATRDWAANARAADWLNHSGGRLEDAERVALRPDLAADLSADARDYLHQCRAREDAIQAEKEAAAQQLRERLAEAQLNQSRFLTSIAEAELRDGNIERALLIAREALPRDMRKPDRPIWNGATAVLVAAGLRDRAIAVLVGHTEEVMSAAFSPDGKWLVTASKDQTAQLWDAVTGAGLTTLTGHTHAVYSAAFSPDGRRIVTGSGDGTARLWDAASGAALATFEGRREYRLDAAFSSDGKRVVTSSYNENTARLWDATSGAALATIEGHTSGVCSASFSPDGKQLLTASFDGTVRLWDAASGAALCTLKVRDAYDSGSTTAAFSPDGKRVVTVSERVGQVWDATSGARLTTFAGYCTALSPDGTRVVTVSRDKTARVCDAVSGAALATFDSRHPIGVIIAFSPDGKRVATASSDHTTRLWDATSGALLATFAGHTGEVFTAAFSPDGTRVVTASWDHTARLWDAVEGGATLATLERHTDRVISAMFSPDGKWVVTASGDNTARLWDAASGTTLDIFDSHGKPLYGAVFSPDGKRVVTVSDDHTARLWDVSEGGAPRAGIQHPIVGWISIALSTTLEGHTNRVISAVFSRDGKQVLTASFDKTARLWEAASGAALATLEGHTGWVNSAAFSPDGKRVVTASTDGTARLWDVASYTQTTQRRRQRIQRAALAKLKGHANGVNSAVFSPDGQQVVTASWDGTARLWDGKTLAVLAVLTGHRDRVSSAVFSPDGARIVTASEDHTARLWDAASGAALAILEGHMRPVNSAAFSPDGQRVVTASHDHTARLWDAASGAVLAIFEGHTDIVWRAAFSPDGKQVVTASGDQTARLWRAWPLSRDDTAAYVAIAAMRKLTPGERSRAFLTVGNAEATAELDRRRQLTERLDIERAEAGDRDLERALLHYAVAVRLYEEQGREQEARHARARRGFLARILAPEVAVRIAYEAMDWRPAADG